MDLPAAARQVGAAAAGMRSEPMPAEAAICPEFGSHYAKSKRSRFITLFQAATKSRRKACCPSLLA